jgi:predicted Rdx family selenoprotein
VTLIPGRRGSFEVTFNGELIFSKEVSDRFPEAMEVEQTVQRRLGLLGDGTPAPADVPAEEAV